jgi:hypothetical protein
MGDGDLQARSDDDGRGSTIIRFRRIGGGFFRGHRRRPAQTLVLVLVVLAIAQITVQLLLNLWSRAVFDRYGFAMGAQLPDARL